MESPRQELQSTWLKTEAHPPRMNPTPMHNRKLRRLSHVPRSLPVRVSSQREVHAAGPPCGPGSRCTFGSYLAAHGLRTVTLQPLKCQCRETPPCTSTLVSVSHLLVPRSSSTCSRYPSIPHCLNSCHCLAQVAVEGHWTSRTSQFSGLPSTHACRVCPSLLPAPRVIYRPTASRPL